jgi:hypothetical protein
VLPTLLLQYGANRRQETFNALPPSSVDHSIFRVFVNRKEDRMQSVCNLFVLATLREGGGSPTPPHPFWSAWIYFSTWERLFLVGLGAVSIYVLFCATFTLLRIRKIRALIQDGNGSDAEKIFASLRKRSSRMDKLVVTAFYVFGMVLFLGLQWSYFTIDNSKMPGGWIILSSFEPHFVFAFNAFFVFLVLHSLGWFISNSLDRFALHLKQ